MRGHGASESVCCTLTLVRILLWITYMPVAGQRHERLKQKNHRQGTGIQLHVHLSALSIMHQLINCALKRRKLAGVELEQFISRLSSLSQKCAGSRLVSGGTPSVGVRTRTHTMVCVNHTGWKQRHAHNMPGQLTFQWGAATLSVSLHSPSAVWRYHWSQHGELKVWSMRNKWRALWPCAEAKLGQTAQSCGKLREVRRERARSRLLMCAWTADIFRSFASSP